MKASERTAKGWKTRRHSKRPQAYSQRSFSRYKALGFEAKIRYAERIIEAALCESRRPLVAWSGGKCSTVVLHLVRRFLKDVDVLFNDTKVEFPETIEFVNKWAEKWKLNLHIARPPKGITIWWCIKNYGWPLLGKDFSPNIKAKIEKYGVKVSDRCCYWLKEKPSKELYRKLGTDCVFLGIRALESNRRWMNHLFFGDYYCTKEGILKAHPISIWTGEDVDRFLFQEGLPISSLYSFGRAQAGCWVCGMGIRKGSLKALREGHPKLFRTLILKKGLGEVLLKIKLALSDGQLNLFAEHYDLETLLKVRPCFFDRI